MSETKLSTAYDALEERKHLPLNLPAIITDNISQQLPLRAYQVSAIARFIEYYEQEPNKEFPIQLLFNMATGSGKTLIMVAAMLYLYEKGYRNFVFFVDKTNIIAKTMDNFLNKASSKFLFNQRVFIDGQQILVKQVDNFTEASTDAINIYFSTISGLHSRLGNPKENSITFGDFEKEKTVFISDEAHHINAITKKNKSKEEEDNIKSWEHTVNRLVQSHKDNVLLEFTATIDWKDANIFNKYKSRVLIEYDLRKFREDKFSKDIFLLQSDAEIDERMLHAVIISQYRRKVAEKHKIALKPVILFKSKTIKESQDNHRYFMSAIQNLKAADLLALKKIAESVEDESSIFKKAFSFFTAQGIKPSELVQELQIEFSNDRLVEVNSTEESEQKQILVNTLEDESNPVRAIFAVDKLNEGWDVLNLFDIVRLYGTRDSGKPTIQEAQLVGRGARYYPFVIDDSEKKYVRKLDEDLGNELRVIEQLHFHSIQNHRYISELRQALIQSGIHKDEGREITLKVKDSFKQSRFYDKGVLWKNRRIINKREHVNSIFDVGVSTTYSIALDSGASMSETTVFEEITVRTANETKVTTKKIGELPLHVVRKALDRIPFFYYENIVKYFPKLISIDDFISDNKYLGGISIEICTQKGTYTNENLFKKLNPLLEGIKNSIRSNSSEFEGTKEFVPVPVQEVVMEKTMFIAKPSVGSDQEFGRSMSTESRNDLLFNLSDKNWYVFSDDYGTDEEKYLVKFIAERMTHLLNTFREVFLIRNQKIVEIYDFEQGRRFEPDYLLFLGDGKKESSYIQLFIEPKGGHIEDSDKWKEEFLLTIKKENEVLNLFQNDKYNVFGLPFYKESTKQAFDKALSKLIS